MAEWFHLLRAPRSATTAGDDPATNANPNAGPLEKTGAADPRGGRRRPDDSSTDADPENPSFCKCGGAVEFDAKHATMVCSECGTIKRYVAMDHYMAIKEFNKATECSKNGCYKPPNHFAEIVAQFQGKRLVTAPDDVVDLVRDDFARYGVKKKEITALMVRKFLERCQGGNQYYKFCPEIAYRISGIPPPHMNAIEEEQLYKLFSYTVCAYRTSPRYLMRKANRVGRIKPTPNNMGYHYVFYKLCELCGFDRFLPYINLPKSDAGITDNDENGWKHVCKLNNWKYIKTI